MKLLHRTALAATALAVTGLLAACSSSGSAPMSSMGPTASSGSMSSTNAHNAQDTTFTQMMIVHHTGAIAMSDLAATRASSTQVKDLATQIKAAQQPEITEMTSWLKAWGEPLTMPGMDTAPTPMPSSMPGMTMSPAPSGGGMADMPGMTPQDMATLAADTGPAFDKEFLTLMILHHESAVSMAKGELSKGQNAAAMKLAQSIVTSQSKQITTMKAMLTALN
jgi:uncharacterized protein (DUF305 family)